VVVTQQQPPRDIGADESEHLLDGRCHRLRGRVTVSMFGDVPAEALSVPANGVTLPSFTVGAPSVPHITFGASVVIEPSWSLAGPGGRRCGESKLFSPMIRSTRAG
jgi:hypothetical protein